MFDRMRFNNRIAALNEHLDKNIKSCVNTAVREGMGYRDAYHMACGVNYHSMWITYVNHVFFGGKDKSTNSHRLDVEALMCQLWCLVSESDVLAEDTSYFRRAIEFGAIQSAKGKIEIEDDVYWPKILWEMNSEAFLLAIKLLHERTPDLGKKKQMAAISTMTLAHGIKV